MAFVVVQHTTLPETSWEGLFGLFSDYSTLVIRDWAWDLINYYPAEPLDLFNKGGATAAAAGGAAAWVA